MSHCNSIRVIPDIHGEPEMLRAAVGDHDNIILLGDLVDNGPDSVGALRVALDLILSGRARLVRSNHDEKLYRALSGASVRRIGALGETLDALRQAPDFEDLVGAFMEIYPSTPFILREGRFIFAHAAIDPRIFSHEGASLVNQLDRNRHRYALFGQVDGSKHEDGRPIRHYDWVDDIPRGFTAIVGHDNRNAGKPYRQSGRRGGSAIFMDTGCGKGGPLSYIDLPDERIGQIPPRA